MLKNHSKAMKHSIAIAFLVTISLVTSAVDKTNSARSEFFENWKKDAVLQKGENMKLASDETAISVQKIVLSHPELKGWPFVGLAVNIRNQSPFKLGKPTTFQHCGFQVGHSLKEFPSAQN